MENAPNTGLLLCLPNSCYLSFLPQNLFVFLTEMAASQQEEKKLEYSLVVLEGSSVGFEASFDNEGEANL